ncbi:MAG: NAD(P)/FAD-dependent oxidoreductase [Pseudomonadota bacterium]
MSAYEVLVIGGGIAGAAAAYELAATRKVVVVEREAFCGYHSTGRSAASFTEYYGNAVIRRLARASRAFFEHPPDGLSDSPLVAPRGLVTIARTDQRQAVAAALACGREFASALYEIAPDEARERVPVLRPDYVAAAIFEPGSLDLDVHGVHQAFLKGARARGGTILTGAEVSALEHRNGAFEIATSTGRFEAALVVNAAGAWADRVAAMAGARPVGLVPQRRTAFNIDPPEGLEVGSWPLVTDIDEEFYFKPDAGRLLVSPADATPSEPTDAQPEDIDVAIGVERLERATTLSVQRVTHKWAGLRTFAADGSPVVGRDPELEGFYWLAGQGGYGIKTSPALARALAGLIERDALPEDLTQAGVRAAELSPRRFRTGS